MRSPDDQPLCSAARSPFRRLRQHSGGVGKNRRVATLILLVGLPAAGKTTLARRLATEHRALRLTPDEWMIPLFGDSDGAGKRYVLEGRMITVALQLLRLETNVVLDFGCWIRDERWALRWLTEREGAVFHLVYLPIERTAQLERIDQRWSRAPHETFAVAPPDLDRWRALFDVPDSAELAGQPPPDPPPGWSSWLDWATGRWPSLTTDETGRPPPS